MNSAKQHIGPISRTDLERMTEAILFAIRAHKQQTRKDGGPYIVHPLRIFLQTVRMGLSTEAMIAAVLHDVIEDTNVELSEIEASFGEQVASLVTSLTKPPRGTPDRAVIYREQLMDASREAKIIKLLDIEDNLFDVDGAFPPEKATSYREKQTKLSRLLKEPDWN